MSALSTLSAADRAIVQALREFILAYLAPGMPVVRGLGNRVSKPAADRYAVITPLTVTRHATNLHGYDVQAETMTVTERATRRVQVDFYGEDADSLAATLSTLIGDPVAVQAMSETGVAPLYAGEPRAMPEADGRGEWTNRWTMDLMVQFDAAATLAQPRFDSVNLTLHPQA